MIAALNNVQLQVNISVKFRLHSMTDAQTWHGQILGIVGYDVARLHEDVDATNNNMETNIAKKNPVSMTFLLVKCDDGMIRPFSTDWIVESSFVRTDNVSDTTVIIHNISETEAATLITYIRNLGYTVSTP